MRRHPQARDWTYEAVAKLRGKLIDLSRKSPLIVFKHTSRSASQLRFVDERPDLLFERLGQGCMGFEPLPGEEQTPKDERTPQFGIAYERARLTDAEFLAATEKLGQDESNARGWQDAERALRAGVRAQLGLPKLDYGRPRRSPRSVDSFADPRRIGLGDRRCFEPIVESRQRVGG